MPAIHRLSWSDVDSLTRQTAVLVQSEGIPDTIIGIHRGGLIPAVMLAHMLALRTVVGLDVRRTSDDCVGASKFAPQLFQPTESLTSLRGADVLVVDDVSGSGATVDFVRRTLGDFRPARVRMLALVVNRQNWDVARFGSPGSILNYVAKQVDGWIVFPWEEVSGVNT